MVGSLFGFGSKFCGRDAKWNVLHSNQRGEHSAGGGWHVGEDHTGLRASEWAADSFLAFLVLRTGKHGLPCTALDSRHRFDRFLYHLPDSADQQQPRKVAVVLDDFHQENTVTV